MSKIRFHILLAALLVVTGCGEDDKVLPEQQQQFEVSFPVATSLVW
ncbi:MAG: hypothetical protein ACLVJK_10265 [Alistipes putredinis]